MSWLCNWKGRASDILPDQLPVRGTVGPGWRIARDAIWESLQAIASLNPDSYVRVVASGWESPRTAPEDINAGRFTIMVDTLPGQSALDKQLEEQQPIDLLNSQSDFSSRSADPARESQG